jgi:perosamine synthetase
MTRLRVSVGKGDALVTGGKRPRRETFLPYGRHTLDDDDRAAVAEVLRGDWLTTGPKVAEFEAAFARAVGAREAVAVSSGTAALHLAVLAAGVGEGHEVVTTPMTFAGTANSVLFAGARPVFADVEADTLNMDPERVRAALTERTRAILAVDYAGRPCRLDELREIAESRGCALLEDACHALGARSGGAPVGSLSDFSAFSLHPVKAITTGEGGVVTTDNAHAAERMRRLRHHGIRPPGDPGEAWHYRIDELGYNYRITDFQCALGLSQLAKLPGFLARRREIAEAYHRKLAGCPLVLPPPDPDSAWHLYVVRLDRARTDADRAEVFRALRAANIGVQVHYLPVHCHELYRKMGYRPGSCPAAERAYEEMFSLPLWPGMTDDDVEDVVAAVREVLAG